MSSTEFEHRWLVEFPPDTSLHYPTIINQAYPVIQEDGYCIRVRRAVSVGANRQEGESRDTLAVKGPRHGLARSEEEWEIEPQTALALYKAAKFKLVKSRYQFVYMNFLWDLDQFHHDNDGLWIAECEVTSPTQSPETPPWCSYQIHYERRYDNEQLAMHPYNTWT